MSSHTANKVAIKEAKPPDALTFSSLYESEDP